MPDEQLIFGTGSEMVFTEAAPEGAIPQSLWVRVGLVFQGDEPLKDPGVWINYQHRYLESGLEGPVLMSPAAWRELNLEVEERLQAKGVMPPDLGDAS